VALIAAMPATAAAATCPDGREGAGWTLSTTTFDNHFTRHAYVGNGYLSQRVPPAGTGYMATGETTGWPLFTPRYDGAFVGASTASTRRSSTQTGGRAPSMPPSPRGPP
jgi:hypothetical protein